MERTVGMPAMALIRSGGLLFVRAANEGRTVAEMFPKERVATDFDSLADALFGVAPTAPATKTAMRIFPRQKESAGIRVGRSRTRREGLTPASRRPRG